MFDIENAIKEWRRRMEKAGVNNQKTLDELESHLRAEFDHRVAAGAPEAEAFQLAAQRLGQPQAVGAEFGKISAGHIWPVRIGFFLFAAAIIIFQPIGVLNGFMDAIGAGQFILVIAGYLAVFFASAFGIFRICFDLSDTLSNVRRQSLNRAINLFNMIAVWLVLLAFILGLIWVNDHAAQFARNGRLPYAVGNGLCCIWLAVIVVLQQWGRLRERTNGLLAVTGGILVLLASYARPLVRFARGGGMGGHWIFLTIVAVHLVFLAVGLARKPELAPSKS